MPDSTADGSGEPLPDLSSEGAARLGGLLAGLDRLEPILNLPDHPGVCEPAVVFGRYRLWAKLGAGSHGVVLLATDTQLGRGVVVKVPQPAVLTDAELRDRFVREARAAAQLDHPGIVSVYEAGEIDGLPYLAAGYVAGPSLSAWLEDHPGPVPPVDGAWLVATLATAVQHAHERGVLHCDLTPSNVLLNPNEAARPGSLTSYTPAVTDFGLARLVADDPALTRTFQVAGTPLYMAPEQARGERRNLTARTDVYALGAILYRLLTGEPPFRGESGAEVLIRVQSAPAPCPSSVNPRVPRDLRAVCLKCLDKDPSRRYGSAAELAADLNSYLLGYPVSARQVDPAARVARWVLRHPVRTAALLTLVLLLTSLVVLLGDRWAADIQHAADLRAAAAETAKARESAAASEFVITLERVRRRRTELEPDWSAENLADLRDLAGSPVAADHLHTLRTEAAAALAGVDLPPPRAIAVGFKAYAPAFHPDGKLLAVGSWGADSQGTCRVMILDIATGAEVRTLTYPTDPAWDRRYGRANADGCRAIAWGAGGRWLVVGTRSGRLVRWDLTLTDPQPSIWAHSTPGADPRSEHLTGLAFTPTGGVLLSVGHGRAIGWDVANGWSEAFRRGTTAARLARPARTDDPVLFLTADGQGHRVRDNPPWTEPAVLPGATVAVGPRGEWSLGQNPSTTHLQLSHGSEAPIPSWSFHMPGDDRAEDGGIYDVLVNPPGDLVVTTAEHRRHLKVWSVVTGELVAARTLDGGSLRIAFSPDGRFLAVTADTSTLLFEIRSRGVCEPIAVGPVGIADADLSADGRSGATLGMSDYRSQLARVTVWRADEQPRAAYALEPWGDNNRVVAVGTNAGWAGFASGEGGLVHTTPFEKAVRFDERSLRDLRADRHGRLWSVGDSGLRGWNPDAAPTEPLVPVVAVPRAGAPIYDCLAPGLKGVWAGRADGVICRHPWAGGPADRVHRAFPVGVTGIAWSDDGRVLAGSATGSVRVLDADTGRALVDLPTAHRDAVPAVAFLSGGWFATGSRDRTVKVWNPTGQLVLTLPQTRPVRRLFWSPDGCALTVLAEGERGLRRWNVRALATALEELRLKPELPPH